MGKTMIANNAARAFRDVGFTVTDAPGLPFGADITLGGYEFHFGATETEPSSWALWGNPMLCPHLNQMIAHGLAAHPVIILKRIEQYLEGVKP